MSNRKDPLQEALKEGRSYTWTIPEGGNLASMRAAVKHGQTLTMSPVVDPNEVHVGDMVLVQWHNSTIFHLVGEIQNDQFLIVNSVGKVNGWVTGSKILGRITEIVEPEPRPELLDMLAQLEETYRFVMARDKPSEDDAGRLLSVVDDLRWYADRISFERCNTMPRSNIWSFEQNMWRLARSSKQAASSESPPDVDQFIDRGKECVGKAATLLALFENDATV